MSRRTDSFLSRQQAKEIDYRNVEQLGRYLTNWGKIRSSRETGATAKQQRQLTRAIKRARFLGLLPYTKR